MHLTSFHFYPYKNYRYSKPVKGLRGYGVGCGFAFNGQEKDDEVSGAGNTMSAEFWEYDSRLGRRWNLDPVIVIGESEYLTFSNCPIFYTDPDGDYSKLGALWRNAYFGGKGISKSKVTGEWAYEKGVSGGTSLRDGLTDSERKTRTDEFKKTHILIQDVGWVERNSASITTYIPNLMDNISKSNNFFVKLGYNLVDGFYLTGQNLFTKNLIGNGNASHLNGEFASVNDNLDAFFNSATSFLPFNKLKDGLGYLKPLNASEFAVLSKGLLPKISKVTKGKINKIINFTRKWINGKTQSAVIPASKFVDKKLDESKKEK